MQIGPHELSDGSACLITLDGIELGSLRFGRFGATASGLYSVPSSARSTTGLHCFSAEYCGKAVVRREYCGKAVARSRRDTATVNVMRILAGRAESGGI